MGTNVNDEIPLDEMRASLRQVERFCLQYEDSIHKEFFEGLLDRIRFVSNIVDPPVEKVREAYREAIAMLVDLCEPPSRNTADSIFNELKEVVADRQFLGPNFHVSILVERDNGEDRDALPWDLESDLRTNLPQRRPLDDYSRAVLQEFRSQLPPSDQLFRDQARNDEWGG